MLQGARQLDLISLVPNLEPAVSEVSGSSDDEDVPPPLPPPRTESLKKRSSEDDSEAGEVARAGERLEDKKVVITDAEPYSSLYSRPLTNGGLQPGSSTESSSENSSPNKCILTSGKLEEKKR